MHKIITDGHHQNQHERPLKVIRPCNLYSQYHKFQQGCVHKDSWPQNDTDVSRKTNAARAVIEMIDDGMIVGFGSGSISQT